jgi:hypothetical protein
LVSSDRLPLSEGRLIETGRQEEGGVWLSRKPPGARSFKGRCMWLRQS